MMKDGRHQQKLTYLYDVLLFGFLSSVLFSLFFFLLQAVNQVELINKAFWVVFIDL